MLSVHEVSKSYGNKKALDKIELQLSHGVYALLGPNGAGKSTLIKIITGNISPTFGIVEYKGKNIAHNLKDYCQKIGYMPQNQGIYDNFSATEFLWYMASLKGIQQKDCKKEIKELFSLVGLDLVANEKIKKYSGGMKQRVLFAQSLLGNPEILILDEPTAGLDPMERILMRNQISNLSSNKIIVFATHVVSDIESIAKKVILLNHGKIVDQESPFDLCQRLLNCVYECHVPHNILPVLKNRYKISNLQELDDLIKIRIVVSPEQQLTFVEEFKKEFSFVDTLVPVMPNLQDVYLSIMGISGRDGLSTEDNNGNLAI